MAYIKEYYEYRWNKYYDDDFFWRHAYPSRYKDRVKEIDSRLSNDSNILSKIGNFFERMEQKIKNMSYGIQRTQQQRRYERGGGPDTGIEILFGLPSIIPNILKKVFNYSNIKINKSFKNKKKEKIDLEFIRHLNDKFIKENLPHINSEKDLEKYFIEKYQKAGMNIGDSPILDEIMRNHANIYYMKEKNPYIYSFNKFKDNY